ncbi:MAG: hypothetical protein K0S76_106 [Herbinix sp.]|jgi:hypothetical protein|nr:hypothetical protein [Herbinix sp.]
MNNISILKALSFIEHYDNKKGCPRHQMASKTSYIFVSYLLVVC